jgi:hypothetical membrane protein
LVQQRGVTGDGWDVRRITWVTGLLGSLILSLGSVITALAYSGTADQRYSPLNHWVSELGELGVSELAGVFNVSLIMGGLFLAVFMVGLASTLRHWLAYVAGAIGLIAGIAGMFVGVFPMNNLDAHSMAALTFFNTGWIAVALFSLYILVDRQRQLPRWLVAIGVLTILSFIGFLSELQGVTGEALAAPGAGNRPDFWLLVVYEWLVIGTMLVWVFLVSLHLRRVEKD